jgi:hypothetical protein
MARGGMGEVELHLHHDGDTSASLAADVRRYVAQIASHGHFARVGGAPRFAFIHGNWCLANARPDGRNCGVDDEVKLLRKLEGGGEMAETIYFLVERGIPVMGHVGLMPQRVNALGGYKFQGRDDDAAEDIFQDALAVQEAGAFSLVIEGVKETVAREISGNARNSVRAAKRVSDLIAAGTLAETPESRGLYDASFGSPEFAEGTLAFIEKRSPKF